MWRKFEENPKAYKRGVKFEKKLIRKLEKSEKKFEEELYKISTFLIFPFRPFFCGPPGKKPSTKDSIYLLIFPLFLWSFNLVLQNFPNNS